MFDSRRNIAFGRDDTRAVKGLAVILMMYHHLAAFTDRFPLWFEGFDSHFPPISGTSWVTVFANAGKLCVGIFFFLGGYGLYKRYRDGRLSVIDSVFSLLKKYWRVFFIFAPIALIFFRRSGDEVISNLSGRYAEIDTRTAITCLIGNFTTLSSSINPEWWFICSYICALVMGGAYCHIMRKQDRFIIEIIAVFILEVLFRSIIPGLSQTTAFAALSSNFIYTTFFRNLSTVGIFLMGIVFAKYDGVVKLKKRICGLPFGTLISFFGILAVIWSRCFIVGEQADIVYAPFFAVFASVVLDLSKHVKRFWGHIGGHSTNLWLIHSFYCYYFLEATRVVYLTTNVVIDLLILFIMSYISSVIVELVYKILGGIKENAELFFFGNDDGNDSEKKDTGKTEQQPSISDSKGT